MRIPRLWGAVLLICLTCAGCDTTSNLGPLSPEELDALNKSVEASPTLQAGEKIRITVFGEDRLSGEYEIDPAGYVSLPLAGNVKASGLSKPQLEQALAKKFRSEYLRDPKVTVDVASFRPFFIFGEVARPGKYPFESGLNAITATTLAGGSTYRASRTKILIQHSGEAGFHEYSLAPNVPVLPGDLIKVPERFF
ncbi:polysaccharide export protein [Methylocystis heyeri]|uniref:Polysaccharide export protein n=2 Tax=Methylocystis heyeri TaxID=391905 RepID=A0A6B8KLK9_9HYPH|nr:polysaccharide export protein [Methylocystis heyeri]